MKYSDPSMKYKYCKNTSGKSPAFKTLSKKPLIYSAAAYSIKSAFRGKLNPSVCHKKQISISPNLEIHGFNWTGKVQKMYS